MPSYSGRNWLEQIVVKATEELTGRRWYQWRYHLAIKEYERLLASETEEAPPFFDFALNRLNIHYDMRFIGDERIPNNGPLLVVSNHPTGFSDGMIIASLIYRFRPDLRFLANGFLNEFKYMRPWLLSLPDPDFPREGDNVQQISSLRAAFSYLKDGHCLAVFPATRLWDYQPDGSFADPPWKPEIAKFAQIRTEGRKGVPVLPVYLDVKNTPLFRMASKRGWRPMRRGLLIHEMIRQQHKTVNVTVGKLIAPEEFAHIQDKNLRIAFLRARCDALKP